MANETRVLVVEPHEIDRYARAIVRISDKGHPAASAPLEAALASCMIISARMELAEQGLDDTGVGVAVEVEREEAVSRFRYTLILPPQLEGHRSALLARLERSPVRTTLSKTLEFAPGGTE